MFGTLGTFFRREDGTTAIEYAFITALISIAAVGGFTAFSNEMEGLWNYIGSSFNEATDQ